MRGGGGWSLGRWGGEHSGEGGGRLCGREGFAKGERGRGGYRGVERSVVISSWMRGQGWFAQWNCWIL